MSIAAMIAIHQEHLIVRPTLKNSTVFSSAL